MKNFLFFLFLILPFNFVFSQNNCFPYPCAPCTIQGEVITNSTDCGITNSISITLTNGVAPFTFVIKKAGEDALPPVVQNSRTRIWNNLSPGHYYVWAIDSEGCIWTGECKNLGPIRSYMSAKSFCGHNNSVCVSVFGGIQPYTYQWSNDIYNHVCIYDLTTGKYSVTVTDANGCISLDSLEIEQFEELTVVENNLQPTCNKLGEIILKAKGGLGPYNFIVRKNGQTGVVSDKTSDSLLFVKNVTTGTYKVTVTDANWCTQTLSFNIYPQPTKKETQVFLSGCGDIILPWGEIVTSSGVFVKKYTMNNGCDSIVTAVVTSTFSQDSLLRIEEHCSSWTAPNGIVFNESGYFLDSILGNDGCEKRLVTGVFIKKPVVRSFMDSYCYGSTPSIIVDGFEYNSDTILVSECDTTFIRFAELSAPKKVKLQDSIFCLEPFSNPLNQEQILEIVKNSSGCDSVIYYRNLIGIPVSMQTDTVSICVGNEFIWAKNNQIYKDQGLYTYIDSSSSCKKYYQLVLFETEPGIIFQTINTCDSLVAGFKLILGIGNCDPDTILLTTLVLNKKLIVESVCDGDKFLFQDLEYNPGTYKITVPGLKCDTVVTLIINQSPSVFFSSNIQNISCFGKDDGEIELNIFSDDPNMTIKWSNGFEKEKIVNLSLGSYSVTITNSYGCTAGQTFIISEPEKLVLSLDTTNVTCKGKDGSISLDISGGTTPYHFVWNDLYESQNLEDLSPGTYSVLVTDNNGCTEVASRVLLEPECVSECEVLVRSIVGSNGPYVEINNDRLSGKLTYQIVDEMGVLVYESNFGDISPGYRFKGILNLALENGAFFILFKVDNWYTPAVCFIIKN